MLSKIPFLNEPVNPQNWTKNLLEDSVLQGQTALVISGDDPVAPIQVLGKFAKEFELPKFKVGVVEGTFQDSANLTKLSTLPRPRCTYLDNFLEA